jgi:hypothetical protein
MQENAFSPTRGEIERAGALPEAQDLSARFWKTVIVPAWMREAPG